MHCGLYFLLTSVSLRIFSSAEMSFLEKQQLLAKQIWEDEQELKAAQEKKLSGGSSGVGKGKGADKTSIEYDEESDEYEYDSEDYDDYYADGEDAYEPYEPDPPKRKPRGFKKTEAVGFQDIIKPIQHKELLSQVAIMMKCHSEIVDASGKPKPEKPTPKKIVPKAVRILLDIMFLIMV